MSFDAPNLLQLVHVMIPVDSLVALHMSDLGICENADFANELLQALSVEQTRLTEDAMLPRARNKLVTNT